VIGPNDSWQILGGLVFDGLGSPPVRATVSIDHGRISAIGPPAGTAQRIDALGAWVLPGFVDAHSHADLAAISGTSMELRHRAGVTTEIVGNDGLGYAPWTAEAPNVIAGLLAAVTNARPPVPGWTTIGSYLDAVDHGSYSRVATLVPHAAVRASVCGPSDETPTTHEVGQMVAMVEEGLSDGAVGLSTGLSYPPGRFSTTEELVELARPLAARGLPYVTHLRDYGDHFNEAIDEAIDIARAAVAPLHLSHFYVSGPGRAGQTDVFLAKLVAARRSGMPLSLDSYPYVHACTILSATLPDWLVREPFPRILRLLENPGTADRAATEVEAAGPGSTFAVGWDGILLVGLAGTPNADLVGLSVSQAATRRGISRGRLVVDLCRDHELRVCVLVHQGHLDNIRKIALQPNHVVGSDGILGSGVPHPRAGGAFLRYLRWARTGEIAMPVEKAVGMMTAATASIFSLPVGRLVPGAPADVLVVDPLQLTEGPDVGQADPMAVRWSFIAGRPVLADGAWIGGPSGGLALRAMAREALR